MKLKDLKLGQSFVFSAFPEKEMDAVTYEEYKKLHPGTKKDKDDPAFSDSPRHPKNVAKREKRDIEHGEHVEKHLEGSGADEEHKQKLHKLLNHVNEFGEKGGHYNTIKNKLEDFKSGKDKSLVHITKDKEGKHGYIVPNYHAKPEGKIGEGKPTNYLNDPFSHGVEQKYGQGKKLIQEHVKSGKPADIHTSSDMISYDDYLDEVKKLPKGSTVHMYHQDEDKKHEHMLPSNQRIDKAAEKLKNAGVNVEVHK